MEKRNLTCICCPLGCSLQVKMNHGEVEQVTGNTCKRGVEYAKKEVTNPTRIVTTTVRVKGGALQMVSVKTQCDIPKNKISACMKALKDICVEAPVRIGDTVLEDIAGTKIAVIATKNVEIIQ